MENGKNFPPDTIPRAYEEKRETGPPPEAPVPTPLTEPQRRFAAQYHALIYGFLLEKKLEIREYYDMELMMYPFLTMNDHAEIVYSHLLDDGRVKIYVEKPDEHDGFHHAVCFLPGCRWEDIVGFGDAEIQEYQKVIKASAEQIMRLATSGKG